MKCTFCGNTIGAEDLRCPHCGKTISESTPTPGSPRIDSSAAPAQDEELEKLLRHMPSALGAGGRLVLMLIFGLMFLGLAIFCFVVKPKGGPPPLFIKIFFVLFGLAGLAMVTGGVRGLVKLVKSPLQRLPAVVVGKRQKTSTSKYSDPIIYFLTIKTDDGRTKEHTVKEEVFAAVEEGDTGVAYIKGGYLLDFKPVRLSKS